MLVNLDEFDAAVHGFVVPMPDPLIAVVAAQIAPGCDAMLADDVRLVEWTHRESEAIGETVLVWR